MTNSNNHRYGDERMAHFNETIQHAGEARFPGSTVVDLRLIGKQNPVELAEVHKLFELAGFEPQKSVPVLSAGELAEILKPYVKTVQADGKNLIVVVESGDKSFVYLGLPTVFYEKYFQHAKLTQQFKKE